MASSWAQSGTSSNGNANGASSFMSIKQAIAGPTPPQSYATLVKAVLRYRQKRVYILAFAGVVLTLPGSTLPAAGFGELNACVNPAVKNTTNIRLYVPSAETTISLLYPTVWLFLAIAFVGTLPVFVARKQYLQSRRSRNIPGSLKYSIS